MSYDIHITKAEHWIYSEKSLITAEDLEKVSNLLDTFKADPNLLESIKKFNILSMAREKLLKYLVKEWKGTSRI
ncbi:hypothetical protein C2I18_03975 [Paenibacillus sp. PK3_47]|nr:hypothetical protein C2I18_03975 [Paenibacillus sp. PK3_47]